jgi:chemotaxis signal transduction protein
MREELAKAIESVLLSADRGMNDETFGVIVDNVNDILNMDEDDVEAVAECLGIDVDDDGVMEDLNDELQGMRTGSMGHSYIVY